MASLIKPLDPVTPPEDFGEYKWGRWPARAQDLKIGDDPTLDAKQFAPLFADFVNHGLTGDQITPENRLLRNTVRKVRKFFVERWADKNGELWNPPKNWNETYGEP